MEEYLLESYVPRTGADTLRDVAAHARSTAKAMTEEGTPVRYVRSIFLAEDEVCFHVYEAPSAEAASEAGRRAGIAFERVIAARTLDGGCLPSSPLPKRRES